MPSQPLTEPHGSRHPGAFFVLGIDAGRAVTLAAGTGLEEVFGRPDELMGRPGREALRGCPELFAALERALDGEQSEEHLTIQGSRLEVHVAPASSRDVRAVAECVAASGPTGIPRSNQLRFLLQRLPAFLWTTDENLRVTDAAGSLLSAIHLPPSEALGHTIPELVGARDPADPAVAHHLAAAFAGESSSYLYDFRGRTFHTYLEPLATGGVLGVAVDATTEQRHARDLTRKEANLAVAQRLAHVGSWEWDVQRDRVEWSEELSRIYGVAPGHFEGTFQAFLSRVHPDDRADTERVILEALHRGGHFRHEHRVVRPDGSVRALRTVGEGIRHDGREKMVGCCLDETERRAAEKAGEHARGLLAATIEATEDGLLAVDVDGRVTLHNDRFLEQWHVPVSIVSRLDDASLLEFAMPQVANPESFVARVHEIYAHPDLPSQDVLRFKDGRVFERTSRPQRLGGRAVGRVWSFHDVTSREQLYERAVLLADAGRLLASLDAEPAVEAVAKLAIPLLGETCTLDLLSEAEGPRRLFAVGCRPGKPALEELPRAAFAGHQLVYEQGGHACLATPLLVHDRLIGILGFIARPGQGYGEDERSLAQDLADRMALTLENTRLYRHAQSSLRARDEFLSVAAHELRGPLTPLRIAVDALREGGISEPMRGRLLDTCHRQVRQMATFVEELLDTTRARTQPLALEMEAVDLAEVVHEVAADFSPEVTRTRSRLSVSVDGALVGRWDRRRLDQLVRNLLGNAVKYGLRRPVEVVLRREGDLARLSVTDHGVGIPLEQQARVFEPFERGSTARQYGGLGLGLYISRLIVDAFGGTIRLESVPGAGTTVTVELPLGKERRP